MRIVKLFLTFVLTAFFILASGCGANVATDSGRQFTESVEADAPTAPALNSIPYFPAVVPVAAKLPKGDGIISYDPAGIETLTSEQEQLLLDYMSLYYQSLADLSAGDPSALFAEDTYGDTPNTTQAATGRSGAWSGVNEFYTYVTNNTGYGMVTEPDANYWAGEPGDLIQLGYEDNWRHVVIITEVIKDEVGNTVDYLINSNTADQRSYPVSAYLYPQQRLIKIYGWNEG